MSYQNLIAIRDSLLSYLSAPANQSIFDAVKKFCGTAASRNYVDLEAFLLDGKLNIDGVAEIGGSGGGGPGGKFRGRDFFPFTPNPSDVPSSLLDSTAESVLREAYGEYEKKFIELLPDPTLLLSYADFWPAFGNRSILGDVRAVHPALVQHVEGIRQRLTDSFDSSGNLLPEEEAASNAEGSSEERAARPQVISDIYTSAEWGAFSQFINVATGRNPILDDPVNNPEEILGEILRGAGGRPNTGAVFPLIYNLNISGLATIQDYSTARSLLATMESTGLLTLLSYADEIRDFAERRLSSVDSVKGPVSSVIQGPDNTFESFGWYTQISGIFQRIKSNPIGFATINYYFPGLTTYFINVLSIVSDFSNNGRGGSLDDPANNPEEILDSLERAFGLNEEGDPVFQLAFKFEDTAQRLKKAILRSPFRSNIPPVSPQVYGLRLGAANFYVPPVSIDVNTRFKTGSLTGGAIRQPSSPKFNSGYKETTISLQLFFPNYEEIWGISIDPSTEITLDQDFQIDFKKDGTSEKEIDKFLSSLRGLVAAFKYSPILPVRNHYLNTVHGVSAVALSGMSISTVPNYPFSLMVQIELLNFNHKPFLPMISDFNQAIHWGKYRHYMGNAAGKLHAYVNEGFLMKESDFKDVNSDPDEDSEWMPGMPGLPPELDAIGSGPEEDVSDTASLARYSNQVMRTNVVDEWRNGSNISFYIPAETQTKIFLPDTASFRSEQEKIILETGLPFWERQLKRIGLDMQGEYVRPLSTVIDLSREKPFTTTVQNSLRRLVDFITAGVNEETTQRQVYAYLVEEFLLLNESRLDSNAQQRRVKIDWLKNFDSPTNTYPQEELFIIGGESKEVSLNQVKLTFKDISSDLQSLLDSIIDRQLQREIRSDDDQREARREQLKRQYIDAFNVLVYDRVFASGPIQQLMAAARYRNAGYQLREWEVPMIRVDMDPENVLVTGVSVSLGNNFAPMQVQMMDEPTYQHIGGRDTVISVSMIIRGEKELLKFKRVFDHINNLARLEQAAGVIGFLGIKNVICALSGVKYVMPMNYSVNTVPNFPHYYNVELSLVDFDVFQQKREEISSKQQADLVEHFSTKKNPFLRIKQLWSKTNTYPDLPLSVIDEDNEIAGYLDPDFYFRSFEMFDQDVVRNISDQEDRVRTSNINRKAQDPQAAMRLVQDFLNIYFRVVGEARSQETFDERVNRLVANFVQSISSLGVSRRELTGYLQEALVDKYGEESDFSSLLNTVDTQIQEIAADIEVFDFDEEVETFLLSVQNAVNNASAESAFEVRVLNAIARFDQLGIDRLAVIAALRNVYFGNLTETGLEKEIDGIDSNIYNSDLKIIIINQLENTASESYIVNNLGVVKPFGSSNIGDIEAGSVELASYIDQIMKTSTLEGEDEISIDVDDDRFHKVITRIPIATEEDGIPAIMNTAAGQYTGFIRHDAVAGKSRFYLTVDGRTVTAGSDNTSLYLRFKELFDPQSPTVGTTNTLSGVPGMTPLSEYSNPYTGNKVNNQFTEVRRHWENMFIDTSYRDISGRMLRAFPTYMLWLIDEGGYFAGVKMFDNFYGLQSVIDFSVVSSEDLLGDTLVLRVSNLYSKLTLPEDKSIFASNTDEFNPDQLTLGEGIQSVLDSTLNKARNILSGLKNNYIVDINNIRLKPGVRVHLRAGYGSNPNSLQTLFNGIITEVEAGEIVTIVAQSDAIELGAIVNSTNTKGHSGSIDGGIDTGLWMSEPRDLMVRLLSMGTSRFKEGISWATRGIVFSENKFGIRHFGSILYPPLNMQEQAKHQQLQDNLASAYNLLGNLNSFSDAAGAAGSAARAAAPAAGIVAGGLGGMGIAGTGAAFGMQAGAMGGGLMSRGSGTLGMISQLWSNFGARRDLEIFKRNIYPGNGSGLAQFLGGDLDDGWAAIASYDDDAVYSDRVEGYLERNTELVWNRLVEFSQNENNVSANQVLDDLTSESELAGNDGTGVLSNALGVIGAGVGLGLGGPAGAIAGFAAIRGLSGILSGRGSGFANVFRILGVLSPNDDDDIAGFDEVSFRAQTYMRTVWDLFKVCARMLPNYIVAVRPFEDRSTVFYGKPHWVYTAGVVPVTTGMPGDKDLDIEGPDEGFSDIMKALSLEGSQLLDYDAYLQANKPQVNLTTALDTQLDSGGEYAPSRFFVNKVLNFASEPAIYGGPNRQCMLPAIKGVVEVGLHLPVDLGKGQRTSVSLDENRGHKQIRQLPPRYRFPFFNSLTTDGGPVVAESNIRSTTWFATIYSSSFYQEEDSKPLVGPRYEADRDESSGSTSANLAKEFRYLYYGTLPGDRGDGEAIMHALRDFEVDFDFNITPSSGATAFDEATVNYGSLEISGEYAELMENVLSSRGFIRMPFPQKAGDAFTYEDMRAGNKADYWSNPDKILDTSDSDRFTKAKYDPYGEWGSPASYEDEQFYIAMRWPYKPASIEENYFKKMYFNVGGKSADEYEIPWVERDDLELRGTAADYKARKVLVYNDRIKRAVVCRPAYFMWGEKEGNWRRENDAIVSPDAAFHLGLLTSPDVYDFRNNGNRSRSSEYLDSGFTTFPYRQECYFAFVPDNIPVGVVGPALAQAHNFELEDADQSGQIDGVDDFVIGFGHFSSGNLTAKLTPRPTGGGPRGGASGRSSGLRAADSLSLYTTSDHVNLLTADDMAQASRFGGNPLGDGGGRQTYIDAILNADYGALSGDELKKALEDEIDPSNSRSRRGLEWIPSARDRTWSVFTKVYDPIDSISVEARQFYDQNYSAEVSTITGRGRTLLQVQEIWDQFRVGYHNYESVKNIFKQFYNLDPDSEEEFPAFFGDIFKADQSDPEPAIAKFSETASSSTGSALDEFSTIFGTDWYNRSLAETLMPSNSSSENRDRDRAAAIEFVRRNLIDEVPVSGDLSLIEYLNKIIYDALVSVRNIFFMNETTLEMLQYNMSYQPPASTGSPVSDGSGSSVDEEEDEEEDEEGEDDENN